MNARGATDPDLAIRKAALRGRMRALRDRARARQPGAAAAAAALLPIEVLSRARVAASYHPRGSELSPGPLADRCAQAGARIVMPVAVDLDLPLEFRRPVPCGELTPDLLGVPSPPASAPALRPDLVIVPMLAFDRCGRRLGQGAGCYDRTLAALRKEGPVFAVGLAYAAQEVEQAPAGALDERLDAVLTEAEFFLVRADS